MNNIFNLFNIRSFYLSLAFFCVLFTGNSSVFGFPLIVFAIIFLFIFATDIKITLIQYLSVLIISSIFLFKAIFLQNVHNSFYPLWVLSFVLSFLFSIAIIKKLDKYPHITMKMMVYAFIPILILFIFGTFFNQINGRAEFIFGPNMLYRIVGFLFIIGAGYLLYTGQKIATLLLCIPSYSALFLTGSRGALIVIVISLLLFFHIYQKKLSILNISILSIIIMMIVFFSDIDLSDSRLFYFENITNFENTNYIDAYARLKPVLYLYFEPDRFSIIGITHQEYLELFYSPRHLYPHNIFLELIIFYGWFGVFVTIIVIYLMFKLVLLIFNTRITFFTIFCYSIIALFLSTMLSGDMGDNGAVLGTIFAIFWHLDILKKVKN